MCCILNKTALGNAFLNLGGLWDLLSLLRFDVASVRVLRTSSLGNLTIGIVITRHTAADKL